MDNTGKEIDYTEEEYLDEEWLHDESNNGLDNSTKDNKKTRAEWTKPAVLTLLCLYESNAHLIENPKKKEKIWSAISKEMNEMGFDVSHEQVRWKFNALYGKYKECIDYNNQSGRSLKTFEYFNEMESIFGYSTRVNPSFTLSSLLPSTSEPSTSSTMPTNPGVSSECSRSFSLNIPSSSASTTLKMKESISSVSNKTSTKNSKKKKDDTSSGVVIRNPKKLKKTTEMDRVLEFFNQEQKRRMERDEELLSSKKKAHHLKERQLLIREKELEAKKMIEYKKLELKEQSQKAIIEIEKSKCNLLTKLLHNKENEPNNNTSESDSD